MNKNKEYIKIISALMDAHLKGEKLYKQSVILPGDHNVLCIYDSHGLIDGIIFLEPIAKATTIDKRQITFQEAKEIVSKWRTKKK